VWKKEIFVVLHTEEKKSIYNKKNKVRKENKACKVLNSAKIYLSYSSPIIIIMNE